MKTRKHQKIIRARRPICGLLNDGDSARLYLYGEVGPEDWLSESMASASTVRDQLEELENSNPRIPITAYINSPGGNYDEGLAIYSQIKRWEGPTTAIIDGWAASIASVIPMAFDIVKINPMGLIMIHNPMRGVFGDERELAKNIALLQKTKASLVAAYTAKTNLSESEIAEFMDDETWFTAQESFDLGFVNEIESFADEGEESLAVSAMKRISRAFVNSPNAKRYMHWPPLRPKSTEEIKMPDEKVTPDSAGLDAGQIKELISQTVNSAVTQSVGPAVQEAVQEAVQARAQKEEIKGLELVFPGQKELINKALAENWTVEKAKAQLFDALGKKSEEGPAGGTLGVRAGEDAGDKFKTAVFRSLIVKAGYEKAEKKERENEFFGYNLFELARHSLRVRNQVVPGDRLKMLSMAFNHSVSDFPALLEDVANKAMMEGWESAPETYQIWTRAGRLADFKTAKRAGLENFASLPLVRPGAEYTYATIAETGEPIALGTYGHIFAIDRQAIINDDLSAFTTVPEDQGRAARATLGDLAYGVLTLNPQMSDGNPLFDAAHNNLQSPGGVPSVDEFDLTQAAMRTQKSLLRTGSSGTARNLNIRVAYWLCPAALETKCVELMSSTINPDTSSGAANPIANMAQVVSDARLDDDSAKAWYLATTPGGNRTVEVATLDGTNEPRLEQQVGFTIDGLAFKVSIDGAAAPMDWRGLQKNEGGA